MLLVENMDGVMDCVTGGKLNMEQNHVSRAFSVPLACGLVRWRFHLKKVASYVVCAGGVASAVCVVSCARNIILKVDHQFVIA